MKRTLRLFSVASLSLVTAAALAQEPVGAEAALREAAKRRESAGANELPEGALARKIGAFGVEAKGMAPAQAGAEWLKLFDALLADRTGMNGSMGSLIAVLPAPEAWDAIATGLRARATGKPSGLASSLLLLSETLRGNVAGQWKAVEALMTGRQGKSPSYVGWQYLQVYRALAEATGDRVRLANTVAMSIADKSMQGQVLTVPALVTLVGPVAAERILLQALRTPGRPLYIEDAATRKLAQQLAITHLKELKTAQWGLVDSQSATKLYPAMIARFGAAAPKGAAPLAPQEARAYYAFGLFFEGNRAAAVKLARTLTVGARDTSGLSQQDPKVERAFGTPAFTAFLRDAVKGAPASSLWDLYSVSAARSHGSAAVVTSLQGELGSPKLKPALRLKLRERLAKALLASDRVDEGLALMKKLIVEAGLKGSGIGRALEYAELGRLLGRTAVVEEGLAFARRASGHSDGVDESVDLSSFLLDLGRPVEAERAAIDAYVNSVRPTGPGESFGQPISRSLVALAQLYYRLNRPADVRRLLDGAPEWGVGDALSLAKSSAYLSQDEPNPIGYVAAWALAKTGNPAAAEPIVNRVIAAQPGFDPAYALLVEIKGADALPRLDEIFATDQFEERPMIWKAVVLKDAGRLDEAERVARQAIAIDPSDGETHHGHRLFAYSVLADIRAAKGDAEGAGELREAVNAIRIAEQGDRLAEAGLLQRALAKYEESTERFSAAYCVQSRLALQLMEQGREKEAAEHYRRAYELMPSSFGRVETHCMGCEGVFNGPIAQNVAESVFTSLVKKTPDKPQVHYLLGYLRAGQGRLGDAMALYRKAVALDPDYLNAWRAMATVAPLTTVTPAERKTISNAILRLDPLQRHGYATPSGDLRLLWRMADRALAALGWAESAPSYRLAASFARSAGQPVPYYVSSYEEYGSRPSTPGAAVARNVVVQLAASLIDMRNTFVTK